MHWGDSRDREAAAEPAVLQRCLACYVRDHTMKSCQPLGSGLINKAFRAAQESDKPQHSKPFPGTQGAFLHLVGIGVAVVYPQAARQKCKAHLLWTLWRYPSGMGVSDYMYCIAFRFPHFSALWKDCGSAFLFPVRLKVGRPSWPAALRSHFIRPLSTHPWDNNDPSYHSPALCKVFPFVSGTIDYEQ